MAPLTFEQAIDRARQLLEEHAPPGLPFKITFHSGGNGRAIAEIGVKVPEHRSTTEVFEEIRSRGLARPMSGG